ncbi:MAG TPA: outer membrane beta-barrel protein [Pyrinomonadaceae bacterium]|jgi:hypothetical protein
MKNFLTLSATISLLLLLTHSARAQAPANTGEALRRFEVGGHAFAVNGDTLGNGFGVGGRFTYNFNKYLAADNEVNTFLNDEAQHVGTEGLFGLKAGVRYRRIGVFAKARPGFVSNIALNGSFAGQTKPAFDAGGIFEVYMSDHAALRVDVGDTMVLLGRDSTRVGFPNALTGTTHNLQTSFGINLRF